jgi:hypothetical protein
MKYLVVYLDGNNSEKSFTLNSSIEIRKDDIITICDREWLIINRNFIFSFITKGELQYIKLQAKLVSDGSEKKRKSKFNFRRMKGKSSTSF